MWQQTGFITKAAFVPPAHQLCSHAWDATAYTKASAHIVRQEGCAFTTRQRDRDGVRAPVCDWHRTFSGYLIE